tara:strand:+ start:161 stop:286 length:126 start_codon:yes stop_codon:yes gene_type:complete
MSYWEIFTWMTVFILGIGSIIVFLLFLKDIKDILSKFLKEE